MGLVGGGERCIALAGIAWFGISFLRYLLGLLGGREDESPALWIGLDSLGLGIGYGHGHARCAHSLCFFGICWSHGGEHTLRYHFFFALSSHVTYIARDLGVGAPAALAKHTRVTNTRTI
jgi:hypothetical protein